MIVWTEHSSPGDGVRAFGPANESSALVFPETRHLLEEDFPLAATPGVTLAWTGTLAAGFFESHPHTWMGPGRDQLLARCAALDASRLILLPHARHVLNDAAGACAFLDERPEIRIALAPARLFEPGMLDDAYDHLRCAIRMLGPRCALVLREDVAAAGDECQPVAPGTGRLPMDRLDALLAEYVSADVPVITPASPAQAE